MKAGLKTRRQSRPGLGKGLWAGYLQMGGREASQETGLVGEQILVTFPHGAQATRRPDVGEQSARKQWLGARGRRPGPG